MKESSIKHQEVHDPRRELLRRVVGSSTFAKSKRLSGLLEYICELTISGQSEKLNEQHIGEAIFGRSPNYDPAIDGIVRTHASRLRQRLDLYFREEGASEPITIVIPKGGYVPSFELRKSENISLEEPYVRKEGNEPSQGELESAIAQERVRSRGQVLLYSSWLLVAILAATSLYLGMRLNSRRSSEPPIHPLWAHIFTPGQSTLVIPGDNGFVMWQGLMNRNIGLNEYIKGDFRNRISPSPSTEERLAWVLGNRRYTSIVDLEATKLLTQVAVAASSGIEIRYARDARPNDLRDNNVVLIGAPEANPWVELFQSNMNFVLENDRAKNVFAIINRNPQRGEPVKWISQGEPTNQVYALIAYLPGMNEKRSALILAGTAMSGTECALNFLFDDKELTPWLQKVVRSDGSLRHFEIVLGTRSMGGDALKPSVMAWRTLD